MFAYTHSMIETARHTATTSASPTTIWQFYEKVEAWPRWDKSMAWGSIQGAFVSGSTGIMKPKFGPKVRFTLVSVEPEHEFTMVSKMPGCHMYIHHDIERISSTQTRITHRLDLDGPLQSLWAHLLNANLLKGGIERIIQLAEA